MENMKVIFLDVNGRGGHSHHIFMTCNALIENGVEVVLATTRKNELNLNDVKFKYYEVLLSHHEKRTNLRKGINYILSLFIFTLLLLKERPHIIHWHQFRVASLENRLIQFYKWFNIKIVYSAHNILHHEDKSLTEHIKNLHLNYDRIIAHAKDSKEKLINLFGVSADKIYVIPVGEYSQFAGVNLLKSDARKKLEIPENKKVLLFFGYIRKYKGLSLLLQALSEAIIKVPDIFLIIAGEAADDYQIYQKIIDENYLNEITLSAIEYIPLEKVSTYFSASDIVVLPYINIYQSGILYLAFAHKRPVIVTNVGGLPEVVEEGKNGFIIPANDPNALTDAIIKSFADVKKLEEMGNYAYEKAKQDYSWDNIAKKTIEVYKDVLS